MNDTSGQSIMTEYKYLKFKPVDKTKHKSLRKRKTDCWWCYSHGMDYLGFVQWYAPWRQYCFEADPHAVFSPSCLDDISDFLRKVTKEYKSRKNNSSSTKVKQDE